MKPSEAVKMRRHNINAINRGGADDVAPQWALLTKDDRTAGCLCGCGVAWICQKAKVVIILEVLIKALRF